MNHSHTESIRSVLQEIHVPCKKHPTKRIEYVCLRPNCEFDRIYCTACVFKKMHCRHEDFIRDLEEVLNEQRKQYEMKGLLRANHIFECYHNRESNEKDYMERINSQLSIIDEEINNMIKEVTSALESVRKSMHNQMKNFVENFKTSFENFEYKVDENFSSYYMAKFNSFDEIIEKYSPFTLEGLSEMTNNLLQNYQEQFKIPEELESAYNTVVLMRDEAPQFDLRRFNAIKGYFNVFKDKLQQNLTNLISADDEDDLLSHNMSYNPSKSYINAQKILDTSRLIHSPNQGPNKSILRRSQAKSTDRGKGVSQSLQFDSSTLSQNVSVSSLSNLNSSRKIINKSITEQTFGRNHPTIEIRRIQLSASFDSYHSRTVLSLLHMKDTLIASSADDGMIKLWDTISFRCVKVFKGHTAGVRSLALLGNGDLVSASWDKTIRIWPTRNLVSQYNGDDKVIPINESSVTLKGHINAVLVVHVLPDGVTIASGSTDYTIKLWDSETGACVKTFNGHNGEVLALACKADNKTVISGGSDRVIKLWNAEKKLNSCIETLSGHTGPVWCIKLLQDDDTLASGSSDKTIKIWSLSKVTCLRTIIGHQNHILNLSDYKDNTLLTCDNEGVLKIWALSTGACLNTIPNKTGAIHALLVTPDYMIIGGGMDKRIYIWN